MIEFDRVVNGIIRYLNANIFTKMNDWQEMLARIAVSRIIGDANTLKATLSSNPFVRTFGIIDEAGRVDVDGLMRDIKAQIEAKGKLSFALPMLGNFTFYPSDVDELHRYITEG